MNNFLSRGNKIFFYKFRHKIRLRSPIIVGEVENGLLGNESITNRD